MIYFQLFPYKPLYICLKLCTKKASADYDQCLYVILYLVRFVLLANFLFFSFWANRFICPTTNPQCQNLDSLILVFIMPGSGYHILRVCIFNLRSTRLGDMILRGKSIYRATTNTIWVTILSVMQSLGQRIWITGGY